MEGQRGQGDGAVKTPPRSWEEIEKEHLEMLTRCYYGGCDHVKADDAPEKWGGVAYSYNELDGRALRRVAEKGLALVRSLRR